MIDPRDLRRHARAMSKDELRRAQRAADKAVGDEIARLYQADEPFHDALALSLALDDEFERRRR